MVTRRIDISESGPNTEFVTDADMVSQSQAGNYSTVYYYVGAVNLGGTGSYSGDSGTQAAWVGGQGGGGHAGTIPSGVGTGVTRWYDGPYAVNLGHDANGYRGADQVQQNVSGWYPLRVDYGSIGPYPRIPKPPVPPYGVAPKNITPTSVSVDWKWSGDSGGIAVDSYLVRRWNGQTATGTFTDVYSGPNAPYLDKTVQPGAWYTYGVYAHNGVGYSAISGTASIKTLAPVHLKYQGVWHYAVPYVKVSGVWKMAMPYTKVAGVWHTTG